MTGPLLRAGAAILLLPLAACVNMSGLDGGSKYACAAPEGVACDSVSGTYENAIRDNLPSQRHTTGPAAAATRRDAQDPAPEAPARQPPATVLAPDADMPQPQALRSQAHYLRLWIKPWEDIDGDLFDQAHVYVQIDNGRWQIDHIRQAIRERYAPLRPPPATPASEPNAATDAASALSLPVQRPTGTSGFPMLNNPPAAPVGRPAGSPQ